MLLVALPLICLAFMAFGVVFMVAVGFNAHRLVLGVVVGGVFLLIGLIPLGLVAWVLLLADRVLHAQTSEQLSALARDIVMRKPPLAPVPEIAVQLPFSMGSWAGRTTVEPDGLIRVERVFRPTRTFPVSQVAQVALRRIDVFNRYGRDIQRLLVIDANGRCLFFLNTDGNYEDACRLAAALHVPIDVNWEQERTSGWLAREFPGSTTKLEAHPIRATAITVFAILAALALVFSIAGR